MDEWNCPNCTLVNSKELNECAACANRRPATNGNSFSSTLAIRRFTDMQPPATPSLVWRCSICSGENDNGSAVCVLCQNPSPSWICPICTLSNRKQSPMCVVCGANNPFINDRQFQSGFSGITTSSNSVHQQPLKTPLLPTHIDSDFMNDLRQVEEAKAQETYDQIVRYCREDRSNFVDDSFPPNPKSIGVKPTLNVTMIDDYMGETRNFVWLRPHQIKAEPRDLQFVMIRADASPADIKQGVLGNCWFLSALAVRAGGKFLVEKILQHLSFKVVAERPEILEHILLQKTLCPEGVYQIRICWEGQWKVVLVDDHFPCHENKTLAYSQARRKQMWVQLIEKALAKLHGSYNALTGGQTIEGLQLLTGCPCEVIRLQSDADHGDEEFDADLTWAKLLSAREAGFLMGASCGSHDSLQVDGGVLKSLGLLPLHAYSLLDVRQSGSHKLVRLRNPWGQFSWKGSWSDNCDSWTPAMRKAFSPDKSHEGIFWMSFDDLRSFFDRVDICKVRTNWNEIRMLGLLPPHAKQNYVYMSMMDISETTEVVVTLFQQGCRREHFNKVGALDLCVMVFRMNDVGYVDQHVTSSKREIKGAVHCEAVLQPGIYSILTAAFVHFGMDMEEEDIPKCVITFHSTKKLSVDHVVTDSGMLCQGLIRLVMAKAERHEIRGGMRTYSLSQGWSGLIIMVENSHPYRHIHIKCDCSESENVVSTRGTLTTSDSVPPLHRQIIMILTQVDVSSSYLVSHRLTHRQTMEPHLQDWAASPFATHQPPLVEAISSIHSPMRIL